jgi:hypothetical protein
MKPKAIKIKSLSLTLENGETFTVDGKGIVEFSSALDAKGRAVVALKVLQEPRK